MTTRRLVSFVLLVGIAFLALLLGTVPGLCAAAELPPLLVRVVDGNGRPIAGAVVRAAASPENPERPETVIRAETRPDGTARLSGLPDDRIVWVLAEHRGFSPALGRTSGASNDRRGRRELRIVLGPGTLAVGRVVDEKGRPVVGAEAELTGYLFGLHSIPSLPAFLRAWPKVRTGPAGRFRLRNLPAGTYWLRLRHSAFAPLVEDHMVQGGRSGDLGRFVLRRAAVLTGTVTDPEGRPVAGLPLRVGTPGTSTDATTGKDGGFAIPGLPPGRLQLFACGQGYLQQSVTLHFLDEPVQLTLRPAATLRGRVLGPDGEPLAGARLAAQLTGVGPGSRQPWTPCPAKDSATSDADGRFVVGPLAAGWYDLLADAKGMKQDGLRMLRAAADEPGEEVEIRLQASETPPERVIDPADAPAGEPVQGRVVGPDGTPAEGALVAADFVEEPAWTAADGAFVLPRIERKSVFTADKPGFATARLLVDPAVGPVQDLEIRLERGAVVSGRLLGLSEEDLSIPWAYVQVIRSGEPGILASLTHAGVFRAENVPSGTWTLDARAGMLSASRALTVEPGQTEISMDLEMPAASTLSGYVLDDLARPIAGASIEVTGEELSWHTGTHADGSFSLRLPDGSFLIDAFKDGFLWEDSVELQIEGGTVPGLEIRLAPATTLRGRLLGLAPGERPEIRADGADDGISEGEIGLDSYSLTDLKPGVWTIATFLDGPGGRRGLRRTVEVPPGVTEMELDLDFTEAEVEP